MLDRTYEILSDTVVTTHLVKDASESIDFAQLSTDVTKAREKYQEFERKKNDKERELEDLKKMNGKDFGIDGEWESLHGTCFSGESSEWVFICFK